MVRKLVRCQRNGEIPANDSTKIDGTTVIYSLQNMCAFEATYHWTTHSFIGSYI